MGGGFLQRPTLIFATSATRLQQRAPGSGCRDGRRQSLARRVRTSENCIAANAPQVALVALDAAVGGGPGGQPCR
jgi:hypothetical protein